MVYYNTLSLSHFQLRVMLEEMHQGRRTAQESLRVVWREFKVYPLNECIKKEDKVMGKIKKMIRIALGLLFVSIGVIVRFIPGIPTTPFLLLALYFFGKSSERLTLWLKGTYLYKKYLEDYVETRSMSRKQKVSIQAFASMMMALSFIAVDHLIFRMVIVVLFLVHHYVFIFCIKTHQPNKDDEKAKTTS